MKNSESNASDTLFYSRLLAIALVGIVAAILISILHPFKQAAAHTDVLYSGKAITMLKENANTEELEAAIKRCGSRGGYFSPDTGQYSGHRIAVVCETRNVHGFNGRLNLNRSFVTAKDNASPSVLEHAATSQCADRGFSLAFDTGKYSGHRIFLVCGPSLSR